MKEAKDIIKWGVVKPFFKKKYKFNSIDIETIDNELFILGFIKNNVYHYVESDFYNTFHDLIIDSAKCKTDILTWTRYDNTHLLKLVLSKIDKSLRRGVLLKIGKISPIISYEYRNYEITILNIIKDSMIFKIDDRKNKPKTVTIYNLKNLYHTNLEKTAKNYAIIYYSKLGQEYHIIDKKRYKSDLEYKNMCIKANLLDNKVIIDIAYKMLKNFKDITGVYPKTIFTAGSIARSYLMAYPDIDYQDLQFKSIFQHIDYDELLDYSMNAYHGGKIESYILGYVKKGKIIDITSAYPYALGNLPKITNKIWKFIGTEHLNLFFYAFIRCDIEINDPEFIHPVIVKNPINSTNISPYGYLENVIITKTEYDYLLKHNKKVIVHDYIGVEHEDIYPYRKLVDTLFNSRMENVIDNLSLADMFKTIINSLYGITFELTDIFDIDLKDNGSEEIYWKGYRAGDFFNPILASYITGTIRTYLSEVSYNIIENGGKVFLNMTDSIIYDGEVTLDVFSDKKVLGKFEKPEEIKDIIILGAGRYEYKTDYKYIIKNRGFSIAVKDKGFYRDLKLNDEIKVKHKTFVSSYKATTLMYDYEKLGHLVDDTYSINPFNLGGKRVIENYNVKLNKEYTKTKPVRLERGLL